MAYVRSLDELCKITVVIVLCNMTMMILIMEGAIMEMEDGFEGIVVGSG